MKRNLIIAITALTTLLLTSCRYRVNSTAHVFSENLCVVYGYEVKGEDFCDGKRNEYAVFMKNPMLNCEQSMEIISNTILKYTDVRLMQDWMPYHGKWTSHYKVTSTGEIVSVITTDENGTNLVLIKVKDEGWINPLFFN